MYLTSNYNSLKCWLNRNDDSNHSNVFIAERQTLFLSQNITLSMTQVKKVKNRSWSEKCEWKKVVYCLSDGLTQIYYFELDGELEKVKLKSNTLEVVLFSWSTFILNRGEGLMQYQISCIVQSLTDYGLKRNGLPTMLHP